MRPRAGRRVVQDGYETNILRSIIQALIKDSTDALQKEIRSKMEEEEAEREKRRQTGLSKIAPDGRINK